MKEFLLEDTSPEKFVKKLQRLIRLSQLKGIANFSYEENHVILTMTRFGVSKISYDVEQTQEGFKALRPQEKIAITHVALKGQVESWFYEKIEQLGGKFVS